MLRPVIILLLTLSAGWCVPQASSKAELSHLVRLPRLEFAQPLQFDRMSGFIVFPDGTTASAEAAKALADVKYLPEHAAKYLAAARLTQAHGEIAAAIRAYGRAADLYRKKVESQPDVATDIAGLAEAICAIGRGSEALVQIEKAFLLAPSNPQVILSAARVYQERAWQLFAGDQRLFSASPFLNTLKELIKDPPEPSRIAECKRHLKVAAELLSRMRDTEESVHLQRATFYSFEAALNEALVQAQRSEFRPMELQKALFDERAVVELQLAARKTADPSIIAAAGLVTVMAQAGPLPASDAWLTISRPTQQLVLGYCARLEDIADSTLEDSSAAAEYLGCLQVAALRDFSGGQRSFRQAVRHDGRRYRSWELMVLAAAMGNEATEFLEVCQDRFDSLPNARSSVLLATAYDQNGDDLRAELVCLAALAAHPKDFSLNLTLAALLLKRENYGEQLWRVQDALSKAEKQLSGSGTPQNQLDLALLKSIFFGLSDKPGEAKAALSAYTSNVPVPNEVSEVLRILNR